MFRDFEKSINLQISPDVEIVYFRVATDKEKVDFKEQKRNSENIVLQGNGVSDFPAHLISYNHEYLKLFIVVILKIDASRNEINFSKDVNFKILKKSGERWHEVLRFKL